MTQASVKIAQQYINGGVIPADLAGQSAVSKDYVDKEISGVDTTANLAISDITNHKISPVAHSSENITYVGSVAGAANVQQAIDKQNDRINNIVANSGDSNTEIVDAREGYPTLRSRLDVFEGQFSQLKNSKKPLNISTYDGTDMIVHPDIYKVYENFGLSGSDTPAKFFGYTYWMIATPYPSANQFYENPSLYVSNDGIHWAPPLSVENPIVEAPDPRGRVVPYEHNPGFGAFLSDPNILIDPYDNKIKVIYRLQNNETSMLDTILYIESSNAGITWSAPITVLEANYSVLSPAVIQLSQNEFEMYYVKGADGIFSVAKRTSSDMQTWSSEIPLIIPVFYQNKRPWHVDALVTPEGVELLVNCNPSDVHSPDSLFILESNDRTEFTFKNDGLPIIEKSKIGWDNNYIYRAAFERTSDGYYQIWYSGSNLEGQYKIGYLEGFIDNIAGLASESQGVSARQRFSFNKGNVTESYEGIEYAINGDALVLEGMENPNINKKLIRLLDQIEVGGRISIQVNNQPAANSPVIELVNSGVSSVALIPDPNGTNRLKLVARENFNFGAMLLCKNIIISNDGGGGDYSEGFIKIGDFALFSDPTTARLKLNYGFPTSNEQGEIVASIVNVPPTSTSSGKKGQTAADSNYLYICFTDNNWIRVAKNSW